MKKSGYRAVFHIYMIFFLALLGAVIFSVIFFFSVITVHLPDGTGVRSDHPKKFTEDFSKQIVFIDGELRIKQAGMEMLQKNKAGIQILDENGREIISYDKPEYTKTSYSDAQLLKLFETGSQSDKEETAFIGSIAYHNVDYLYIIYFPVNVSKITMYLNGDIFSTGRTIVIICIGIVFVIIVAGGILYGIWITGKMNCISSSIKSIAARSYRPMVIKGAFGDVFESLNSLDTDIRDSDRLREETERMRSEWIANITHDLKTPLSPVKGYAEIMQDNDCISESQLKKYAEIISKNVRSMESLIDDLKLTYQLENGIMPVPKNRHDFVRFAKELVIDILNDPLYENRSVHFKCEEKQILFSFDDKLMARALQNLIINAFCHGNDETEVVLEVVTSGKILDMTVRDNGPGIMPEEADKLFQRYYKGTDTGQKTEGTGLGLAIAKSIIEAQGGTISVESEIHIGTCFKIHFIMQP
ncbi:MAG: HAMP domain-containing sensor histidine kinase [Eubacteriales bacterium]|nr:HAMP domain-containing sensor histidine kinase [Eubacteriales bacterium]